MKLFKKNKVAKFIKSGLLFALFLNFNLGWVFASGEHVCSGDCHAELMSACCETAEKSMEMKCHQEVNITAAISLNDGNCGCEEFNPLNKDKFDAAKRLNFDIKPQVNSQQQDNENLIYKIDYAQVELQTTYTQPPIYLTVSSLLI